MATRGGAREHTNTKRYTAQQVADALAEAKGFTSVAAKKLGCSVQTVRNYVKEYAVCKQACDDAREKMDDTAESALFQQIDEGNIAAIIFYLKTRCRNRGYSERTEILTPEGESLRVVIDR